MTTINRRNFIKTGSLATAALIAIPAWATAGKKNGKLGLQLYTLRDSIEKDTEGVIKSLAGFGYKELEGYGYGDGKIFNMGYQEFCKLVKDNGMQMTSSHYGYGLASGDKWKMAVEDAAKANQPFMVVPSLPGDLRKTISGFKKVCESLNKAGEECKKNGIRFGYHNHAFEFEEVEGEIPYDVMLKELDPAYVGMEMDLYWVVRAGKDPLKYFAAHPGRFEQLHVKDMSKTNKDDNAIIGSGSINFKSIFNKAKQAGVKHWYVEQETYELEPIECVKKSAAYLIKELVQ